MIHGAKFRQLVHPIVRGSTRHALTLLIALTSLAPAAFGAPVRHIALDLDETIIQRDQEYVHDGKKLVPILERIDIESLYPKMKGMQQRTYYIRPGARQFLEYLVREKNAGNLDINFLSLAHQHRLNAVLRAIQVDGKPLIDHVRVAMGEEVVKAYFRKAHGDSPEFLEGKRARKDMTLLTHPDAPRVWSELRQDKRDIPALTAVADQITPNPRPLPSDWLLLDDQSHRAWREQRAQAITITHDPRPEEFWKGYEGAMREPVGPLKDAYERERMLAKVDVDRQQYRLITEFMEEGKRTAEPNNYAVWENLIETPRSMALERAHFKYVIPDLLKHDSPNTDILVLGRDGVYLDRALRELRGPLNIQSPLHYLNISRLVANNHTAELVDVLRTAGIDVDAIKRGERKLRIVDNGYEGSVPKQIIRSFFANDPNWQQGAKNISSFLLTAATNHPGADPAGYATLEDWLAHGAFIEPPTHQARYGHDAFRSVIWHWEHIRPLANDRPDTVINGVVQLKPPTNPVEARYTQVLTDSLAEHFREPAVIESLKKRLAFVRGEPGDYPKFWREQEPGAEAYRVKWLEEATPELREKVKVRNILQNVKPVAQQYADRENLFSLEEVEKFRMRHPNPSHSSPTNESNGISGDPNASSSGKAKKGPVAAVKSAAKEFRRDCRRGFGWLSRRLLAGLGKSGT